MKQEMSTPSPPPPPAQTPPPADTPTTTETPDWLKVGSIGIMVIGILVSLYFFAFHLGAAVLSFQKYGSFLWAILDFFFPYFYYPYYAFVVSKEPTPVEMVGGARRRPVFRRLAKTHGFRRI